MVITKTTSGSPQARQVATLIRTSDLIEGVTIGRLKVEGYSWLTIEGAPVRAGVYKLKHPPGNRRRGGIRIVDDVRNQTVGFISAEGYSRGVEAQARNILIGKAINIDIFQLETVHSYQQGTALSELFKILSSDCILKIVDLKI